MIKIKVPKNNLNERRYIIDVFFQEFLDIPYELKVCEDSNFNNWELELINGNKFIVEDHFFGKYKNDLEYLDLKNLPNEVIFGNIGDDFQSESNIPIIYGENKLEKRKGEGFKEYQLGIDIFSSSFFMLTRWEEYVNKNKDQHKRFSSKDSVAYKFDFLNRPVVNEYINILKNILLALDYTGNFKEYKYELILSHDVDVVTRFPNLKSGLGELTRDLTQRKDVPLFFKNCLLKIKSIFPFFKDPYDTFDRLMDLSEEVGVKSYFFFMAEGQTDFDNRYRTKDELIQKIVEKIKNRGHFIGIHPTYNSYNSLEQFQKEKKELIENFNIDNISFGRQHFLRFEVPTTWQIWEDNSMEWDSTMSYADKEGFRCGICYEYSVFNILTREKLKLKEKPLTVMEGSFATYQDDVDKDEVILKINELKNKVKKYEGTFVLLWHNSSFNTPFWNRFKGVYSEVIR